MWGTQYEQLYIVFFYFPLKVFKIYTIYPILFFQIRTDQSSVITFFYSIQERIINRCIYDHSIFLFCQHLHQPVKSCYNPRRKTNPFFFTSYPWCSFSQVYKCLIISIRYFIISVNAGFYIFNFRLQRRILVHGNPYLPPTSHAALLLRTSCTVHPTYYNLYFFCLRILIFHILFFLSSFQFSVLFFFKFSLASFDSNTCKCCSCS